MEEASLRFIQFPTTTFFAANGLKTFCFPIHDGDSRRWLRLTVVDVDDATEQTWYYNEAAWAPIHNALAAMIDNGQDMNAVVVKADGTVVSTSSDGSADVTPGTYYAPPDDYQLSGSAKPATIARDRLVEVKRLGSFADVVRPVSQPSERLVFKHYEDDKVMTDIWYSTHFLAGMAEHPNFVALRHLVLEERGGVVGYTMPFIPGGTLQSARRSRIFKLKWAKQLLQALDDLNLERGINHQDLRTRNLMVDPTTDNLIIIDLGKARIRGNSLGTCVPPDTSPVTLNLFGPGTAGTEGEKGETAVVDMYLSKDPDVNAAIVTLHDLVTRDPSDTSWEADEADLWNGEGIEALTAGPWTAHPDARLDSPAEAYHTILTDWLRRRRADPRCRMPANPLRVPRYMPIPPGETVDVLDYEDPLYPIPSTSCGILSPILVSGYKFLRRDALRAGRPVVDWVRPVSTALDRSRTLLASGRYADEGEGEDER
ncbi:hypothetical protein B0T16DRAFT_402780 [Cercophora newfieldiana]|uniref:EKC/KEOPS complex subunit BUD32 n=1 Tax=Cercophora newfieldiana TaxID=92897 RepID=A0AA40D2A0_9PEZI|nr:hypothetical protein B0T16DRAFT_402780 [Cercophora newfieldiana]